jgi:multidrug resistance efflux pump
LVRKARAALRHAGNLLKVARNGVKKHQIDIEKQKKAITIAEHKLKALRHDLDKKKKVGHDLISPYDLQALEEGVKALENVVDVEKLTLRQLDLIDPDNAVEQAEQNLAGKQAQLDEAELALKECDLLAPSDGMVLRVFVSVGEPIGANPKAPAIQFCPKGKHIVRAEVLQEWASHVAKGQKVLIEDGTRAGPQWTGHVMQVSDWFAKKRNVIVEPFMFNDVRTLECLIEINPGGPPLRIGQRVRVTIQQGKSS